MYLKVLGLRDNGIGYAAYVVKATQIFVRNIQHPDIKPVEALVLYILIFSYKYTDVTSKNDDYDNLRST